MPTRSKGHRPDKYVRLNQDLHAKLKAQCAMRGCSIQSLVEELVRKELEKKA